MMGLNKKFRIRLSQLEDPHNYYSSSCDMNVGISFMAIHPIAVKNVSIDQSGGLTDLRPHH